MADIVGVDIGSYALKAVGLSGHGRSQAVSIVGSVFNPVGQFLPADEAAFNQLIGSLRQLATEYKFANRPIATILPEALAYTSIVAMPYLSDAELASSIHWEAEQHIPVPLDEVELEYEVLHKPKKGAVGEKMQIMLVAAKKDVIQRVSTLFSEAGLELVHMETSLLACLKGVTSTLLQDQAVAILNMGALSTDVMIVESGKPVLTYTIQTGGLVLTRAIQQGLGLSGQQAEEYKRAYGFDAAQLEGKVKQSMDPVMSILVGEIRKALQYYQSSKTNANIRSILLTGGGSYLPGLSAYFTETLSAEVSVVNPFNGLPAATAIELPKDGATYTVALGLASSGAK
jgi:type IV pilus assembly protein PilM